MLNPVNKAICRTFLCALAFTSFAGAQIVERSRTLADLLQSYPCNSGLAGRHTIVTDCDAADDLGNGEGAFSCFARCDGVDTWAAVSIGGGAGGGGEATSVQGSATLPATCTELDLYQDTDSGGTEFYICTATNTWTKAGTGDGTIGGTLTGTDDLAVCTDGTGGSTIGACTVLNLDNLRLDGNTISSTDTNGNINLTPNGTGQVMHSAGSAAKPSISFAGDPDTGITQSTSPGGNWLDFITVGGSRFRIDANGVRLSAPVFGDGQQIGYGVSRGVTASTAGSGAPRVASAASDSFNIFHNEGSTAANYHSLPTAATGYQFTYVVQDGDGLRVTASTGDTIRSVASVTSSGGYIESTTIGSSITIVAINATEWMATSISGTWSFN